MNFFSFFGAHKIVSLFILFIIVGIGYWGYRTLAQGVTPIQYLVAPATRSTLVASVQGTGQIASTQKVDIKPQSSGLIAHLMISQGQQVRAGQEIALLDQRAALVSLRQAQAGVESAQANYQKVLAGAAASDVQTSQLAVETAQAALSNAQKNFNQVNAQQDLAVANAYSTLLNANLVAQRQPGNLSSVVPIISGRYAGSQEGSYDIRIDAVGTPDSLSDSPHFSLTGLETAGGLVAIVSPAALGTQGLMIQFPANPILGDNWVVSIPNKTGSGYVSAYNAYQSALQARTQAIASAQVSIDNAGQSLKQAQLSLSQKQEPPLPADVAAARAQLFNAQAQLQSAQNTYDANVIRAPFDGQIAQIAMQIGDQASVSSAIATLITTQKFVQISLNEVDAAKVSPGQKATLTVDAIDGLTLTGHVAQVDLVGTVSQGVVSYNVKIALDTQDERVKDGMSVTAGIITDSKLDILAVPNSALKSQGSSHYVLVVAKDVMPNGSDSGQTMISLSTPPEQRSVEIGLANDMATEIISGLQDGEIVVIQTITASSSTTSQSGAAGFRLFGLPGGGGGNFRGNAGGGGGR